jgi:hypothetical protein
VDTLPSVQHFYNLNQDFFLPDVKNISGEEKVMDIHLTNDY